MDSALSLSLDIIRHQAHFHLSLARHQPSFCLCLHGSSLVAGREIKRRGEQECAFALEESYFTVMAFFSAFHFLLYFYYFSNILLVIVPSASFISSITAVFVIFIFSACLSCSFSSSSFSSALICSLHSSLFAVFSANDVHNEYSMHIILVS